VEFFLLTPKRDLLQKNFSRTDSSETLEKTNVLVELIERRKRWLDVVGHVSSEEDEDKGDDKTQPNLPAWQWDETIKGNPLEDKAVSDELERQEKERKEVKEAQERRNKERAAAAAAGAPKSPKPAEKKKTAEKPPPAVAERPAGVEKTTEKAEKQLAPAGTPAAAREGAGQSAADKKKVSEKKKAAAPPSKKPGEKPSALTSVIHPALGKLTKSTKDENVVKALEELKDAFDAAEAVQPGIVHNFIAQVIETLKSAS